MSTSYLSRLNRLRELLKRKNAGGFLVTNLCNVRYLSGFKGSSAFIIITGTRNIFVTDFRYKEDAEKEVRGYEVLIEKGGRIKTIKELAIKLGIRSLCFEASTTYSLFETLSKDIRLRPLRDAVEGLRAVKEPQEISLVRKAVKRAEAAFLDIRPYIRAGRKEREIALLLEERLLKRGCSRMPFDIIVASGTNSAKPHAQATEKKLAHGDLVVIDWGGEADGYYSDMTRTLLLKGGNSDKNLSKKKEIYSTVLAANIKARASVAPDCRCRDIDRTARDIIRSAGYGEFFGHGTGHGVGLDIHEAPSISWTKKDIIRENMVFTIEPGIYIEGLGGVRIEDMVAVRPEGCQTLTRLPRLLDIS